MKPALQQRLESIRLRGNLTIADLATLLERPYHTVRGWLHGSQIGGGPLDAAMTVARIEVLERKIARGQGLPVPRHLVPTARVAYVEKIRASV